MRLTKLVVIAIGVAAVFAGCGGASEEDKKAAVDARALAERNAKRAERENGRGMRVRPSSRATSVCFLRRIAGWTWE